ncbi:MAG: M15 family metallopeptidase, partial [Oscillospiraceae bacterium]|nr:M15 family metallopeptidase [Oscillospiraceae bacterium]
SSIASSEVAAGGSPSSEVIVSSEANAPSSEQASSKAEESSQPIAESKPISSAESLSEDDDSWRLVLINPTHPVENITRENLVAMTVNQKSNGNGKYFDKRAAKYVEQMFAAAKKEGINLLSRSTFRTYNLQQTYFNSSYNGYLNQGLSKAEAKRRALEYVAYPGTSEHHTGLAIDITTTEWVASGKGLLDSFANTEAGKWLEKHAHEYGFILRYPKDKEQYTKIKFEPWHFRYVGADVAAEIYSRGICLEEYLGILD